jgi:hypothetical protein
MKTIKIILLFIITINCNAQYPVINILDLDGSRATDAYYKDVNNLLNNFQGTFIYSNGTTSLKIVLEKKIQQYNGSYYEDLIIGEYQYIQNGIQKINCLSEISTVYNNQKLHNIDGNAIINNNERVWKCPLCPVGENRLRTTIKDPTTDRYAKMIIRRVAVGSQQAIHIKICQVTTKTYLQGTTPPADFSIPIGEYTLIKV